MAWSWEMNTCSLQIKTKAGSTSSGADSIKTYTFGGANTAADAETILEVSDAIGSVISTPVLEVLRVDKYEAVESE